MVGGVEMSVGTNRNELGRVDGYDSPVKTVSPADAPKIARLQLGSAIADPAEFRFKFVVDLVHGVHPLRGSRGYVKPTPCQDADAIG